MHESYEIHRKRAERKSSVQCCAYLIEIETKGKSFAHDAS